MKIDTYACDVCKTQKRDVNSWWLAEFTAASLEIFEWDDGDPDRNAITHLCGVECVNKFVAQWMAKKMEVQHA